MTCSYRKLGILPQVFCLLYLLLSPAHAEDVPLLPQFQAFDAPRDLGDLPFEDAKGKEKSLSDYRGHWVLLNLWATWCAPCRQEMPALDNLQNAFTDHQVAHLVVLPLSVDDAETRTHVFDFFHELNIKHLPILSDGGLNVLKRLHPRGLPTSWLINPNGKAVGEVEGFVQWDSPEAGNLIQYYLQKK